MILEILLHLAGEIIEFMVNRVVELSSVAYKTD